jgi:amino-acid N-acetyltransferase
MLVRRARAGDEDAVVQILRSHPGLEVAFDVDEFWVADDAGFVVGCGRLRRHPDGSLELASVAVEAGVKRQGVGTQVVQAILPSVQKTVFALALAPGFFARFGFRETPREALPRDVKAKADGLCASQAFVAMVRD